ncbi:MAG: threonine synthase [Chloroflexi bacterium]|nr:threonine synthase [Chloroflexota bacterium]
MSFATGLRCRECGREFPHQPVNICEYCFGPLEVVYDYEALRKTLTRELIQKGPASIWRYKDLLPVEGDVVDINAGYTPLIKAKNLGRYLGLDNLYIKNDCVNPTYSFKDRVVAVASTKAREFGLKALACASTGNLACSVAAHAARAGMKAYVFIPADLEQGKVLNTAIYAPTLVALDGSYDEVNRLCNELSDVYDWAFVNINIRSYYAEGSKTLAYEVAEQLGWQAPVNAVVPAASGSLFTKIWKGLNEFQKLGLIDRVGTRMFLAQAGGCAPIATAAQAGSTTIRPIKPKTIAKSLAIGNPADGIYALRVIRESGGAASTAPEEEISEGMKLLAETEGVFTETAGGVVIAGLRRLVASGAIKKDELTVAYITGCGLKTLEAIADKVVPVVHIQPNVESFQKALAEQTEKPVSLVNALRSS